MTLPAALPSPLHQRLRSATAAAHGRLEDLLGLLHLPLRRERFVAYLRHMHAFHDAWEPALARRLGDEAYTAPRRRTALFEQDLRALGAAPCPGANAADEAERLCGSAAAALGSLYVLEGATLGGKVIARRLADAPWCPPEGLRSFNPYGEDTGRRWRETQQRLDAAPPREADAIVAAALDTFACLQRRLAGPQALRPAAEALP